MQIWPAIDMLGGRCVRLSQGDYDRRTEYGDDPAAVARDFVEQGAEYLHLVDLDGAKSGTPANHECVRAILSAVDVPCQLGGGIRDEATIAALIEMGVRRLVVGAKALKEPDWFRAIVRQFPERLVLGIDARNGQVATDGWTETSSLSATDLAADFASEPLAGIVYTDIATDGMLAGPNLSAMAAMAAAIPLPVIASGGVTSVADVAALAEVPMAGCIIGRALYEQRITLPEALAAAAAPTECNPGKDLRS